VLAALLVLAGLVCTWTDFQLVRNRLHPVGLFRDTFRFGLRLGRIYRAPQGHRVIDNVNVDLSFGCF